MGLSLVTPSGESSQAMGVCYQLHKKRNKASDGRVKGEMGTERK